MEIQRIIDTYFLDKNLADQSTDKRPLYQPVFGHPEYDSIVQNNNYQDRINAIAEIIKQYQEQTPQKVIRILDIGAAEGFIDFCLKKIFGDTISITCYEQNLGSVELSNALNKENNYNISFNKVTLCNYELVNNIQNILHIKIYINNK